MFRDTESIRQPSKKIVHSGNGRCVEVRILPETIGLLELRFQSKITERHVSNGVLLSIVREGVQKRGGKRYTEINLTHKTAEMLYLALGPMIKESRRRVRFKFLLEKFAALIHGLQLFHLRIPL